VNDEELAAIRERANELVDWIAAKAKARPNDVSITEDHYVEVVPVLLAEVDRLRTIERKYNGSQAALSKVMRQ
jgi:hypothetical protein